MNECREDKPCCYFHPQEVVVGVCPLCLNERLLILASKQGHYRTHQSVTHRKPPLSFPKIFALPSFLHRLEFRHSKSDDFDHDDASTSQEAFADSFISIKFEDNGVGSWEKSKSKSKSTSTVSKVSLEQCNNMSWNHSFSKESKSVIEHAKPRASSLRWRKRIGHLFQLVRWKRSNKGNVGSKVEGVKVRKGWIRTLTKRRTKE
ncbi:hypothetical protein L1049_026768 [Liquidambar formosana]|uniref:Uncharacterized protein n=1 Tax=Liquidambar formosana TaxID=63359 RepID=A0AAP0NGZ9_LIQFO